MLAGHHRPVKAMVLHQYGGPEVLEPAELPDPKVSPDAVVLRVRAAGVNPVDWKIREGFADDAFDIRFPLVPGWDVAGVVERVGIAVAEFAVGDEVIGYVRSDAIEHGTYAELVAAPVRTLAPKPASLGWAEAAGLPLAGLTAYQALRAVHVGPGDTVLVHAAAGGVGHLAVQLAQIFGAARVIGTASAHNHDFLRELGADPVEYGDGLVERVHALAPGGVDAALDLVGGDTVELSAALVTRPERIVSVLDPAAAEQFGATYVFVRPDPAALAALAGFAGRGDLRVHVFRTYPLSEAAAAQQLVQDGHVRGKVVLRV